MDSGKKNYDFGNGRNSLEMKEENLANSKGKVVNLTDWGLNDGSQIIWIPDGEVTVVMSSGTVFSSLT